MAIENPATIALSIGAAVTLANGILSATIAFVGVRITQRGQDERDRQAYARRLRDLKRERMHETYHDLLAITLKPLRLLKGDPMTRARGISDKELNDLSVKINTAMEELADAEADLLIYTEIGSEVANAFGATVPLLMEYLVHVASNAANLTKGVVTPEALEQIGILRGKAAAITKRLTQAIKEDLKKYDEAF